MIGACLLSEPVIGGHTCLLANANIAAPTLLRCCDVQDVHQSLRERGPDIAVAASDMFQCCWHIVTVVCKRHHLLVLTDVDHPYQPGLCQLSCQASSATLSQLACTLSQIHWAGKGCMQAVPMPMSQRLCPPGAAPYTVAPVYQAGYMPQREQQG
jgi:hypothetical protein